MIDRENYKEDIEKFINIISDNLGKKDNNYIIISHYNSFNISEKVVNCFANLHHNAKILYYDFRGNNMRGAYEPFLGWIKELVTENNVNDFDEIMDKCNIYSLQRETFKSYLINGICKRQEPFVYGEINYERKKVVEGIISFINYFAKIKPIIFVLNNMQNVGESSIRLLSSLIDISNDKIGILSAYNEVNIPAVYIFEQWKELIAKFTKMDVVIDWIGKSSIRNYCSEFTFTQYSVNTYINKINNMFNLLAFEQAEYYLEIIYKKLEIEKLNLSIDQKLSIYDLYAKIEIFSSNNSMALLICENIKNLRTDDISDHMKMKIEYMYNYLFSLVQIHNGKFAIARESADICYNIAEEINDSFLIFGSSLLIHLCKYKGWTNVWLCDDCDEEINLIEMALENKYLNHAAYVYIYAFDNDVSLYRNSEMVQSKIVHVNEGIEIAKKIGNARLLLAAYEKIIMIASANGYFDTSTYYYLNFTKKLVVGNQNKFEEANIYNGLGYNCCATEKYMQAQDYFSEALEIYIKLDNQEYIAETLYNMTINAILAHNYIEADKSISCCMQILNILRMDSMRICHISKIYGLKALCSCKLGRFYKAYSYINSEKQFLEYIIQFDDEKKVNYFWDDDLFLYYYVLALIEYENEKYDDAKRCIDKAEIYAKRLIGGAFFNYVHFAIEKIIIYKTLGLTKEIQEEYDYAIKFCEGRDFYINASRIKYAYLNNQEMIDKIILHNNNVNTDYIIEKTKLIGLKTENIIQRKYMEFLNIWQKVISTQNKDIDELVHSAVISIKNIFFIDHVLIIRRESNKYVAKYNDTKIVIEDQFILEIVRYFEANRMAFVTSKLDKNYKSYMGITSLFDSTRVCSFCGLPLFENEEINSILIAYSVMRDDWCGQNNKIAFENSTLTFFSFIFRQFMNAIVQMEDKQLQKMNMQLKNLNEQLKNMAIMDGLTKLYNRRGFYERILDDEFKVIAEEKNIYVVYCDLDNFKYYNDTFGHEIGDLILQKMALLLQDSCNDNGFVARFGGDEFVMVFGVYNVAEVTEKIKVIFKRLEEENYFKSYIEENLCRSINVPDDKTISCSVGIAKIEGEDFEEGLNEALKNADKTLYYIKKKCKNNFEQWDNVKNIL